MKKASQLKQKTPKRQKKVSKRPEKEKGARTRSLWLEILFLVTLGTFAFAAVGHWLERDDGIVLRLSNPVDVELGFVIQASAFIVDNDPYDPNLIDDFERGAYLWNADDDIALATAEITADDPLAIPGQDAFDINANHLPLRSLTFVTPVTALTVIAPRTNVSPLNVLAMAINS